MMFRAQRLKMYGNAVVPQWAYVMTACIATMERMEAEIEQEM